MLIWFNEQVLIKGATITFFTAMFPLMSFWNIVTNLRKLTLNLRETVQKKKNQGSSKKIMQMLMF